LDVVVGVREPVGLLLASIFQNYPNYFRSLSEMTTTACRSVLLMAGSGGHARNQRICDTIDYVHRWFDVELRGVLGIDVYAQPFEHSQGYAIYENSFARVLVYRYENFGVIGPILEEFLGTTLPTLVNRNIGAEKDYGTLYGEIKQRLRLPAEFLAQQYGSRLAQHFYTPRELDHLAARWRQ
jgi:hypothetical protein